MMPNWGAPQGLFTQDCIGNVLTSVIELDLFA